MSFPFCGNEELTNAGVGKKTMFDTALDDGGVIYVAHSSSRVECEASSVNDNRLS
jgi:hypothetical protein